MQIIALMVFVEGSFTSVIGAPLVGLVAEYAGYKIPGNSHKIGSEAAQESVGLGSESANTGIVVPR